MFDPVYQFLQSIGYPHPIHPTEVHMPIGLVVGALIFSSIAVVFKREKLAEAARYCVILAFIWLFPTLILGIMDWQYFYSGAWLFPIKMKLMLLPLVIVSLGISILLSGKYGPASKGVLILYIMSFCLILAIGYYGGQLVYGGWSPQAPSQYKAGEQIFKANCSGCHPEGGNIAQPNLPVINSPKLLDFNSFIDFIRNPSNPDGSPGIMPAFPESKISNRQSRNLYDYIINVLQMPKRQ